GSASTVQEAFRSDQDIPAALDALASRTDTAGQITLMLLSWSPSSLGERQMAQIKKKAERAARRAKRNTQATASLILGVLSIVLAPISRLSLSYVGPVAANHRFFKRV
ncbi:MAG: hypothetical protein JSU84_00405, partial [Thiotrichales bacterium]